MLEVGSILTCPGSDILGNCLLLGCCRVTETAGHIFMCVGSCFMVTIGVKRMYLGITCWREPLKVARDIARRAVVLWSKHCLCQRGCLRTQ